MPAEYFLITFTLPAELRPLARAHELHPHVHLVMPAAAIDLEHRQWRTKAPGKSKAAYLFNHTALAKVFRAKMLAAIASAALSMPERYPHNRVVDCKSVGSGTARADLSGSLPVSRRHPRAGHPRL